ncbi:MAG: hypothetical protein WD226_07390 [Planctomycetota bacterium]
MDVVIANCFKLGLLALSARWWLPVVKELVLQVKNAADETGASAPSPVSIEPTDSRELFDDVGASAWNKRRRINRRWDTGR